MINDDQLEQQCLIRANHRRLACHYAVLRFAPHPETEEFVNVGVVMSCPALGYLDFKHADPLRHERVARFFPDLTPRVYSAAMQAWAESVKSYRSVPATPTIGTSDDLQQRRDQFALLVRPRESILYYSSVRVILTSHPTTTLAQVFSAYVERPVIAIDGAAAGREDNGEVVTGSDRVPKVSSTLTRQVRTHE